MRNRYHVCMKAKGADSTLIMILGVFDDLEEATSAIKEEGLDKDKSVYIWDTTKSAKVL